MLETLFAPGILPSVNLRSPEGLSMTRVGDVGFDGERKA